MVMHDELHPDTLPLAVVREFLIELASRAGLIRSADELATAVIMSHLSKWPRVDVLTEISQDMMDVAEASQQISVTRTASAAVQADCAGLPAIACIDMIATFCQTSCQESGVAVAAIRNTGGMRTLDVWSRYLGTNGLITLIVWNGGPYAAVPYGGVEAFFGTNPLSFSIPTSGTAVVADFATTEIAYMDLKRGLESGSELPEKAGVNSEGEVSRDPEDVFVPPDSGRLLPMGGGPKGSALVLLIEVLAGAFSGGAMGRAASSTYRAEEFSGIVLALRADLFDTMDSFMSASQRLFYDIRSSAPAKSSGAVRLPGDRPAELYARCKESGIQVSPTFRDLITDAS